MHWAKEAQAGTQQGHVLSIIIRGHSGRVQIAGLQVDAVLTGVKLICIAEPVNKLLVLTEGGDA